MSNVLGIKKASTYPSDNTSGGLQVLVDISEVPGYTPGARLLIKSAKLTTNAGAGRPLEILDSSGAVAYTEYITQHAPTIYDFGPGWLLEPDADFVINKALDYPMRCTVVAELITP